MKLQIVTVLFFFCTLVLFAQDSPAKKLKSLKGEVTKVTVTSDSGSVTFEGKEAKALVKKMRQHKAAYFKIVMPRCEADESNLDCCGEDAMNFEDFDMEDLPCPPSGCQKQIGNHMKAFKIFSDCDSTNPNNLHFSFKGLNDCDFSLPDLKSLLQGMVINDDSIEIRINKKMVRLDSLMHNLKTKIKAEKDAHGKKVIIINNDDGNEDVQVYTGKDADTKLKELNSKDKNKSKQKKVIIKTEKKSSADQNDKDSNE
ncbi:MAG: hypothetical protein LWX56_09935 [Ignavibacteria bacterium]|nr:hypothetical protein [Ignavibacteria bacterium]